MGDFYSTAKELHTTLQMLAILSSSLDVDVIELQKARDVLHSCEVNLYSNEVRVPGVLSYQELLLRYSTLMDSIKAIKNKLCVLASRANVDITALPIDSKRLACTLFDPASLDQLPIKRDELIIYQLELIQDVVKALIADRTLPPDTAVIRRFINHKYEPVIRTITEYVSFQGKINIRSLQLLWDKGYAAMDRVDGYYPPHVELSLKGIATIQIPIRS